MIIDKEELVIFKSLSIVELRGYALPSEIVGSFGWIMNNYEVNTTLKPCDYGIIESNSEDFTFLIASDEVNDFLEFAVKNKYDFSYVVLVGEPIVFGDKNAAILILQHPEGWVLAS